MYHNRQTLSLATIVLVLFVSSAGRAQTPADSAHSPWHHVLVAGLNLAEVSFTHWSQGGTNALSYLSGVNGKSVREDTNTSWATTYKFDFGQARLGDQGVRKTDDEINIESMFIEKFGLHVNPYVSLSLLTQFAPGYQYSDTASPQQVSAFFDPAYIKEGAGAGFLITKGLQTRLGLALREIITSQFPQYAAEPKEGESKKIRVTGGLESVTELEVALDDNVLLRAKAELFGPLNTLDRIVLHGETSIVAKVSKVFSTQLAAFFINDPDLSPYTQIKQGLSIGISYALLE